MNNIGIILPTLEITQLAFEVISNINDDILNGTKTNYTIFFQELSTKCLNPLCAVMSVAEIHTFHGKVISTSLDTTELMLKSPTSSERVFYVWDLEFIRDKSNYLRSLFLYRNPQLKIVSRSEDYARALEIFANRRSDLIQNKISLKDM